MKLKQILNVFLIVMFFLKSTYGSSADFLGTEQSQQEVEDKQIFIDFTDYWRASIHKYDIEHVISPGVQCKNCYETLTFNEFSASMFLWLLHGLVEGHDTFVKLKIRLDNYLKLLADNISVEELQDFMVATANEMKIDCPKCREFIQWERRRSPLDFSRVAYGERPAITDQ